MISGYVRKNARMIFWHHNVHLIMFLLARDKDRYKEMMKDIRGQLADGRVIEVTARETLTIQLKWNTGVSSVDPTFCLLAAVCWRTLTRHLISSGLLKGGLMISGTSPGNESSNGCAPT